MEVTVILSQLSDVARVRDFYTRSVALADDEKEDPVTTELDNTLPGEGTKSAPDVPQ